MLKNFKSHLDLIQSPLILQEKKQRHRESMRVAGVCNASHKQNQKYHEHT